MADLTLWRPFQELRALENMMDRLMESSIFDLPTIWQSSTRSFPLDVVENDDEFVVKASLPGIDPDDLDVTFSDGTLTIKGEIREDAEDKDEQARYHLRERFHGSCSRSITLPVPVNADDIQATYQDGVLTLHIPKAEDVRPKRIPIRSGEGQKMLQG